MQLRSLADLATSLARVTRELSWMLTDRARWSSRLIYPLMTALLAATTAQGDQQDSWPPWIESRTTPWDTRWEHSLASTDDQLATVSWSEALQGSTWSWQVLPEGLMYRPYLAGVKESRFSTAYLHDPDYGWVWDNTLGAQVGVIRYGNQSAIRSQGFQVDMEGAVFPRLDVEHKDDVITMDFRFGVPFTWAQDNVSVKFGYYHFSSHLGDEFMIRNPDIPRRNYVRNGLLLGISVMLDPDVRTYSEAGWAFDADGGARPWEFPFGSEYSPTQSTGFRPALFAAVNANLRQEVGFGGNINVVGGWQWRSATSDRLWRIGAQYFNGKSSQYSFFRRFEQLTGFGMWFDF